MPNRIAAVMGQNEGLPVTFKEVEHAAAAQHLAVLGGFHCTGEPGLPKGAQTLLLLGPLEPGFWQHFKAQPEWTEFQTSGTPDPVDRWSRRVIGGLACTFDGKALFPFGGPPHHPFYAWALRTGRAWASPVKLLVQAEQGLLVSYRGALALRSRLDLPEAAASPCTGCAQPCLTACPVGALGAQGYDVPRCQSYLATGPECMNFGCAVRRACPVSADYARLPEHSAYHMGIFHK